MLFRAGVLVLLWLAAGTSATSTRREKRVKNRLAQISKSKSADKSEISDCSDDSTVDFPDSAGEGRRWKAAVFSTNVPYPENDLHAATSDSSQPGVFNFYVGFDGPSAPQHQRDLLDQVFGASNPENFQLKSLTLWKRGHNVALFEGAFYQIGYLLSTIHSITMRFSILREGVSVDPTETRHEYLYCELPTCLTATLVARAIFMQARQLDELNGIVLGRQHEEGVCMLILVKAATEELVRIVGAALRANRVRASKLNFATSFVNGKVPDFIANSWLLAHSQSSLHFVALHKKNVITSL